MDSSSLRQAAIEYAMTRNLTPGQRIYVNVPVHAPINFTDVTSYVSTSTVIPTIGYVVGVDPVGGYYARTVEEQVHTWDGTPSVYWNTEKYLSRLKFSREQEKVSSKLPKERRAWSLSKKDLRPKKPRRNK